MFVFYLSFWGCTGIISCAFSSSVQHRNSPTVTDALKSGLFSIRGPNLGILKGAEKPLFPNSPSLACMFLRPVIHMQRVPRRAQVVTERCRSGAEGGHAPHQPRRSPACRSLRPHATLQRQREREQPGTGGSAASGGEGSAGGSWGGTANLQRDDSPRDVLLEGKREIGTAAVFEGP